MPTPIGKNIIKAIYKIAKQNKTTLKQVKYCQHITKLVMKGDPENILNFSKEMLSKLEDKKSLFLFSELQTPYLLIKNKIKTGGHHGSN